MYKPNLIKLDYPCNTYPIGKNIQANMLGILNYQKVIQDTFGEDLRTINLICRGSSGAIIAGIIASGLPNSKITFIKKEGTSSHDFHPELFLSSDYINIIVDDFFATGETLMAIYRAITEDGDTKHIDMLVISNELEKDHDWGIKSLGIELQSESGIMYDFFQEARPTYITHT